MLYSAIVQICDNGCSALIENIGLSPILTSFFSKCVTIPRHLRLGILTIKSVFKFRTVTTRKCFVILLIVIGMGVWLQRACWESG